ncbi:asparagine synthase (glutamine-hydrolyzing) [Leptolyngbyaceae cyanobacterium JSC-12]|nr:asparagine synthase (glutamine-hydrolyzing) [Leptolyngbyaceae cyanobacterium JSC-12]
MNGIHASEAASLLALGQVNKLPDNWQKEGNLAIAPSTPFTISSNQRFVIAGTAWFPQQKSCNPLEWIAQQWQQLESNTWQTLIGAFAIAVWDREQQALWLGRDRSGIQTLYYTINGSTHWISDQLRALNSYRSNQLDYVALRDYLTCAFVSGSRTLWEDVREVRPGTAVQLPEGTIHPYWQLQEQVENEEQPLEWHGSRLRSLLDQVVQEYLPREPVGVFLSGGLDSSSVTALAAKFHAYPVHTYSIHFGKDCPNELEFSSLVAEHCETRHHILEIPFNTMWNALPETMANLDDPIGDPLTVPNLLLGRLAKESVGVVLNGEGGDPCFGGPKNQPMLINSLYSSVTQQEALQAYLISFQKCAVDLPNLLKPDIWSKVQAESWIFSDDLNSSQRYLNRLMALNIKFKGADHILTKVNNLTRAAGLIGRSPLFDQRIVELSMQIPPEHKLSGVQEKAVLKQAVADLLPEAIIHRPKSGMMVPVQLGFREYWNRRAKSLLLSRRAAIAPYLNQSLIRNWLNYQGDTWNRYGVKLWLLVSLEFWLQANHQTE